MTAGQWRQAIRDALTELDHDDTTSETGAAR